MTLNTLALIPLLPLLAAAITSGMRCGRRSAGIAVVALLGSGVLALIACNEAWGMAGGAHETFNFKWLPIGNTIINFGFVLDPLTGAMAAMVTFVGLLIFIFSIGYMKDDPRMARFFCYLSLFAAGMLGLVLANSLLLLFMCWEIVGLASYLLISFWFHKPEAAAAGRPGVERSHRAGLPHRHLMALAELGGVVAVELQRAGDRRHGVGQDVSRHDA